MTELQIFSNPEFGDQYCILIDGEPYFRAKELCASLDYSNPWDAIQKHVDKDDLVKCEVIDSLGRKQMMNFVNESGMYALIFGSTKESAKQFKRWVTSELIPTIRKTGQYLSEAKTKELEMQNQKLLAEAAENAHKINFFDNVSNLNDDYNKRRTIVISKVASRFKINVKTLNKFLIRKKVIIRVDGGYDIHPQHANKGIAYQIVKEETEYDEYGDILYPGIKFMEYTPDGVELITKHLMEDGMIKKEND